MSLFSGVHEVRLLRPSGIAIGYFDNFEVALRAVEGEPSQYKAAYFTLNPINQPTGISVNPQTLTPSRNAAGASDIGRRVALLVDLDPPRPAGMNSTETEKQEAREQAESVREYLRNRNWPEPMLCDSGNGWHLRYCIDLPNDDAATELVRGVLARLHQLFPMVDLGNFDAPRLCKLYGSFARKGEHSEERPWRRSAIIEVGSDIAVTRAQLQELAAAPEQAAVTSKVDDARVSDLLAFLEHYDVPVHSGPRAVPGGWQIEIECPWEHEHGSENTRDTVVSFIAGRGMGFKCFHSHCVDRHWREFRAELEKRKPTDVYKFQDPPETPPEATKPVDDWRVRYHSHGVMANAPEPTFLIEGILQNGAITAIAAPVGQRKTIIAANMVHACITGELLFDHFKVLNRPTRVLYLCPEMGLFSFAKRIRNLGLMDYVGTTLFCQTMNSDERLRLKDLVPEELQGALVVVDTAVRFVEGDENASQDMKVFADECFRLIRMGALSVLVLFHSPKGTKDATDLTLENAMRGSGDLGAFVSCCWATRLQDPNEAWESASYLKNVKQRDFESDPFTVKSDKLGRLHIVDKPGEPVELKTKPTGPKANKDGKDEQRIQFLRDNPDLSHREASEALTRQKMGRSKDWVREKRAEMAMEHAEITYKVGGVTVGPG
jgi:hypothetical protein